MVKEPVKDGDVIVYAREDFGGDVSYPHPETGNVSAFRFEGTLRHVEGHPGRPAEYVVAGKQLPTEFCQRLVEDGVCRLATPDELADTTDAPDGDGDQSGEPSIIVPTPPSPVKMGKSPVAPPIVPRAEDPDAPKPDASKE